MECFVLPGKYKMKFNYLGSDDINFVKDYLDVDIKLIHEDEGEYFEGYDVIVNKTVSEENEAVSNEDQNDESDTEYDLDDILNNF